MLPVPEAEENPTRSQEMPPEAGILYQNTKDVGASLIILANKSVSRKTISICSMVAPFMM